MPRNKISADSILLGTGLALTSATQLRIPHVPIGVGEGLLIIWLTTSVVSIITTRKVISTPLVALVTSFWLLLFFALSLGWLGGIITTRWDSQHGLHNAFAYLFSAVITTLFIIRNQSSERILDVLKILALVSVLGLGGLGTIAILFK